MIIEITNCMGTHKVYVIIVVKIFTMFRKFTLYYVIIVKYVLYHLLRNLPISEK